MIECKRHLLVRDDGKKHDDICTVTLDDYGTGQIRVATFNPGMEDPIFPGDTPKTWPEWEAWTTDKEEASVLYEERINHYLSEGFVSRPVDIFLKNE